LNTSDLCADPRLVWVVAVSLVQASQVICQSGVLPEEGSFPMIGWPLLVVARRRDCLVEVRLGSCSKALCEPVHSVLLERSGAATFLYRLLDAGSV
jgi:hypothetical protein